MKTNSLTREGINLLLIKSAEENAKLTRRNADYEKREREYYLIWTSLSELLRSDVGKVADALTNGQLKSLDEAFLLATELHCTDIPDVPL